MNKTLSKPKKPLYWSERNAWRDAKGRCTKPKSKRWDDYGGRGISMCQRWQDSFDNFIADMGPKPTPQHSLDRINNDKGYSPDNCRWATTAEQASNKRPRKDSVWLTIDGETKILSQWAREAGIDKGTISHRQKKGLTGKALIDPPDESMRKNLKR